MDAIGERGMVARSGDPGGWARRIAGSRSVADLLRLALLATMDLAFGLLLAWFVSPLLGVAFFALVGAFGACAYRETLAPQRRRRAPVA